MPNSPLQGRSVLVTRARRVNDELVDCLEKMGMTVHYCPTIEITDPASFEPLDKAIAEIERFHWLLFTSRNSVERFLTRFEGLGRARTQLSGFKLLAVGKATAAAIEQAGFKVTVVPNEFRAEAAVAALRDFFGDERAISGQQFLFPRAAQGREVLVTELESLGGRVTLVECYQTIIPATAQQQLNSIFQHDKIDVVTFTSPSTVNNMAELVAPRALIELLKQSAIACIGPVTERAVREWGLQPHIIPQESTAPALARAIENYFTNVPPRSL